MISLNFQNLVLLFGFIHGCVLFIAIARIKSKHKTANKYLLFLIGLISMALVGRLAYSPEILALNMKYAMIPDFILYLFGPILYLYVTNLLIQPGSEKKPIWKHFIPAMLHLLYMAFIFSIDNNDYHMMIREGAMNTPVYCIMSFALIHNFIYLLLAYNVVIRYVRKSANKLSFTPPVKYILTILAMVTLCIVIWVISILNALNAGGRPDFNTYLWVWVSLTFIVYVLGYYAIIRPELFRLNIQEEKYKGSRLSGTEIQHHMQKLDHLIRKESLYLNPKLSQPELSERLKINTSVLSRVINEAAQLNFFDFINSYRVEKFIELIDSNKYGHLTNLAIAKEAGFNSKTTFNRAFKKHTGTTPKAYFESKNEGSNISTELSV